MKETINVSLSGEVKSALDKVTKEEGLSRSEVVREAIQDYLFVRKFRRIRATMVEKAQRKGFFSDEDVFERVS
ncbi:MAG TPA: ribbon-helix-helix domain-containing protein [Bacteroidota bacterium]